MDRNQWIVVAVLLAAAVSGAMWFSAGAPEAPPITLVEAESAGRPMLTVHVSGAVAVPGLVRLPPGSRAADAIAAAGGALPEAALGSVNLAAPLADGQHLLVPGRDERLSNATAGGSPVPVNTASAADLESIPGVGPVLAQRIVEHRERNGPFEEVEDLLGVAGIGEAKLAALRESVQVP